MTVASFPSDLFPQKVVEDGWRLRGGLMSDLVGNAAVAPRYFVLIFSGFLGVLYIILCHFGTILGTTGTNYLWSIGIRLPYSGGRASLACVLPTGIPLMLLGDN